MQTPVVTQPGGEIVLGTAVVAQPAYPEQKAPPQALFAHSVPAGSVQPAYYYAAPQGFQASPYAAAVATAIPVAQGVPVQQPRVEVTASFTNGDRVSTGAHQAQYSGNLLDVTHANFFWNNVERIEGMERFPNLIRLTLRGNHLRNLVGLDACPHLRWLDVSTNDLRDFSGAQHIASLEWLDAHSNDLTTLDGLGFAPNLTWLNVHNSNITSLQGLRALPNLRALDASKNELGTTSGVASCPHLIELRLGVNNLTDLAQVAQLRELRALDVASNELDDIPAELGACSLLHSLNVSHNNLGAHNVAQLLAAFSRHSSLRSLAVGRNSFSPEHLQQLRAGLEPIGCAIDASNAVPVEERSDRSAADCGCAVA